MRKSRFDEKSQTSVLVFTGEVFDRELADFINLDTCEGAEQVIAKAKLRCELHKYGEHVYRALYESYVERVENEVYFNWTSWIDEVDALLDGEQFLIDRARVEPNDIMCAARNNLQTLMKLNSCCSLPNDFDKYVECTTTAEIEEIVGIMIFARGTNILTHHINVCRLRQIVLGQNKDWITAAHEFIKSAEMR